MNRIIDSIQSLKLKILDIYIIRKFLGTFIYSITLILIIAIIFDISEKIDDFIEHEAPMKAIVVDYYLNFIPYFGVLFSSLFTFISVIFFTSRMAYRTEIIAILSSGISYRRLLWPYFLSALLIASTSYYFYDFIIPQANKKRLAFEEKYIRGTPHNYTNRNIHKQIEPGVFVYMQSFSNYLNTGFKFSIEKFDGKELKYKLLSDNIQWDSTKSKWVISNYMIREIDGINERISRGTKLDTSLTITPEDFRRRENAIEAMDYYELRDFIAEQKLQGSEDVIISEVERHKRISVPFSTLILTLIGVSLSSRKVRGGIGMHIGLGLGLSFSYILFLQFSSQFAIGGLVNVITAVWIPNIFFALIALYLYKVAPK